MLYHFPYNAYVQYHTHYFLDDAERCKLLGGYQDHHNHTVIYYLAVSVTINSDRCILPPSFSISCFAYLVNSHLVTKSHCIHVLLCRGNMVDAFRMHIMQTKELGTCPVRQIGGCSFLYMRISNVYIVIVVSSNANVACAFKFVVEVCNFFIQKLLEQNLHSLQSHLYNLDGLGILNIRLKLLVLINLAV